MARILIVDDLEANVLVLEQMLRGAGYIAVTSTTDAREVGARHRRHRADLILLDLQMPVLDGFQVLAALRDFDPEANVIVITAEPQHKLRALAAGARDFIAKPFELAEVLARVRNLLEIRLLHRSEAGLSLARLESSQRNAGLGDWDCDLASSRLVWSAELYHILGLPRDQAPPSAALLDRLVHPDDLARVRAEKQAAAERSRPVDLEHRIIRADGEVRHVRQITEVIFDDQCQAVRETGTIQDITARKHAESALRRIEERLQLVARAVGEGIWDWNLAAETLWWDEAFLTAFGFAAGEIAPTVAAWTERIHPSDQDRVVAGIREAVASGAETWTADYGLGLKDGSHAPVRSHGAIVRDAAGKGVRLVGGVRRLTAAGAPVTSR
jgi:PAS domain S-box-containing protein